MSRWRVLLIVGAAGIGILSALGGNWWTFAGMVLTITSVVIDERRQRRSGRPSIRR